MTQAQWKEIMGDNPSHYKTNDNNPVENVSWVDVQIFIGKQNAKYSEHFRLPTEQEWEFAARGGLQSKNFRYSGTNSTPSSTCELPHVAPGGGLSKNENVHNLRHSFTTYLPKAETDIR